MDKIFSYDYSHRYKAEFAPDYTGEAPRSPLSDNRSLGSMIKMLTPSEEKFTPEYNEWLETLSGSTKAMAFLIKRFYRPSWGNNWKKFRWKMISLHRLLCRRKDWSICRKKNKHECVKLIKN